jgi:hypothetical protein
MVGFVAAAVVSIAPAVGVLADHHEKDEKKQDPKAAPATTQKVQPVDFRKLKDLMPAELGGLKRGKVDGERTAMGEFKLSQARATYGDDTKENVPTISVDISDYGAMPGMQGLAFWAGQEIDQEGDEGYTRTVKVQGHTALEQYTNEGKSGSLQVSVANRYFVNVNSSNLSAEEFKKLAEQLPVQKLAELKE